MTIWFFSSSFFSTIPRTLHPPRKKTSWPGMRPFFSSSVRASLNAMRSRLESASTMSSQEIVSFLRLPMRSISMPSSCACRQ
jgi:hypothetical protein